MTFNFSLNPKIEYNKSYIIYGKMEDMKEIDCAACNKTYEVHKKTESSSSEEYNVYVFKRDSKITKLMLCSDMCTVKACFYNLFTGKEKCANCAKDIEKMYRTNIRTGYNIKYIVLYCSLYCAKAPFKCNKTTKYICNNCNKPLKKKGCMKCGGCGMKHYCNTECQKMHWDSNHKHHCKEIQKELKK